MDLYPSHLELKKITLCVAAPDEEALMGERVFQVPSD